MSPVSLVKSFPLVQCLCESHDNLLIKEKETISLVSPETFLIIDSVPCTDYSTKIVTSNDDSFSVLITPLFSNHVRLFNVVDLEIIDKTFDIKVENAFFKDACFSNDSSKLFVLVDHIINGEAESVLLLISLTDFSYNYFFLNEGRKFDSLRFSKDNASLSLLDNQGKISFFSDGKIIKEILLPPFHKLYFFDRGEIIIDAPLGFKVISRNGKVIRDISFLIPDEAINLTDKESILLARQQYLHYQDVNDISHLLSRSYGSECLDLSIAKNYNFLFFLSSEKNLGNGTLYVFSLVDFSLVKTIKIKTKPLSLSYHGSNLAVICQRGCYFYSVTPSES
ncbi:MAG: hypothetical protein WCR67_04840 [Bacilli bacterium]